MNTTHIAHEDNDVWDLIYRGDFEGIDCYFAGIIAAPNIRRPLQHFISVFQGLTLICETALPQDYPLVIGRKEYLSAADIAADIAYLVAYKNRISGSNRYQATPAVLQYLDPAIKPSFVSVGSAARSILAENAS